jgi:hypothetical protein
MPRCGVAASLPLAGTTPGHLLLLLAMAPHKYATIDAVISALEQELEQLPEDDTATDRSGAVRAQCPRAANFAFTRDREAGV